jgi:hypothetical protein
VKDITRRLVVEAMRLGLQGVHGSPESGIRSSWKTYREEGEASGILNA